jgi:hypothetical protein
MPKEQDISCMQPVLWGHRIFYIMGKNGKSVVNNVRTIYNGTTLVRFTTSGKATFKIRSILNHRSYYVNASTLRMMTLHYISTFYRRLSPTTYLRGISNRFGTMSNRDVLTPELLIIAWKNSLHWYRMASTRCTFVNQYSDSWRQ